MSKRHLRRTPATTLTLLLAGFLCLSAGREGRDTWQQPKRVMADLGLKSGDVVADIGCGRGYFTFRLAHVVGKRGKVYATEINEKALKAVADRATSRGIANIRTVLSDPTNTKLTSESLDAAVVVNVLHHVPKDQQLPLVKNIVSALKPGGFLFVLEWRMDADVRHDKKDRISKEDLTKMAEGAGTTLDAEFHYLRNQVFLRFRKPPKSN